MIKQTSLFIILLILLSAGWAIDTRSKTTSFVYGQTIPTPTPNVTATNKPQPTNTPDNNGGGGSSEATSTSQATAIATATATVVPVTIAPTPEDGFLPTAQPCGEPPTVLANNTINVRVGPGTDYALLDQIVFLEVRPIIGRSQYSEWWLIQLANGEQGWIANGFGEIHGYTGGVPLVEAPPLNGETPTPEAEWNPTPNPTCTVTPTATATSEPAATLEPTATAVPSHTPTVTPETEAIAETINTESEELPANTPEPTRDENSAATSIAATVASQEEPKSTPTAEPASNNSSDNNQNAEPIQATAVPLIDEPPTETPNFLPIVGLILVAGGVFAFIIRRQSSH